MSAKGRDALVVACLAVAAACTPAGPKPEATADAIYSGGPIVTVDDARPSAEALAVKDGKILAVGAKSELEKAHKGSATRLVDLGGRALLPGFIDAHGHAFNAGVQKLAANLLPPPDGAGKDVASVVALLQEWKGRNAPAIEKAGWIIGFGYDDSQLAERRHPTAADLDLVSTEVPVVIIHQSGHLAVMNHKGLAVAGVAAGTKDPPGGVIRREKDGKTPNGVLEEMAFFGPIFAVLGALDPQANERIALAGAAAYAGFGFTTAQEGRASRAASETWRKLASEGRLDIDVAAYPDVQAETEYLQQVGTSRTYAGRFRVAGAKLSLDGSPQGKTAWLTKPYVVPPRGQAKTYAGYPAIPKAGDREALVDLAFEKGWPLLAHCNGDAAADAFIDAVAKAEAKHGKADRRTVMIHAQTVREDQLDRMKELGIVPSFFSMHTYYWGDWHRDETLGRERAYRISPTASALRRGMRFTEHHDAPVALPSAIMILHTTVNRTSRSGDVIGSDQRIAPLDAVKSITAWAAWQYFEEDSKGTLAKGKLADMVVLSDNPLTIDPAKIDTIEVLRTIKEGRTVYSKE